MTAKTPNSMLLAAVLSEADHPTFTGLVIQKKGVERGKGDDRKVYANDKVHVVVVTGFSYTRLVERSLKMLQRHTAADYFAMAQPTLEGVDEVEIDGQKFPAPVMSEPLKGFDGAGKAKAERVLTLVDFEEAYAKVTESLEKSLIGENTSTTDHVYDPLVVDGEIVKGGRVYKCCKGTVNETTGEPRVCKCSECNPEDERAAIPGTIYLQGLFISQKVLVPAPNGPAPEAQSGCVTVAKDFIERTLPKSKYVSYVLAPPAKTGINWTLRAGGTAMLQANEAGIHFAPEVKAAMAKVKLTTAA